MSVTFQKTLLAAIIESLLRAKSLVQSLLAYWGSYLGLETSTKTPVANTPRNSTQDFLKETEALFLDPVSHDGLQQLSHNLRKQLLGRLETDMKCMLLSDSHQLPRRTEVGRFVALDVGGSAFRVALVELCGRMSNIGDESRIVSMRNFHITPEIKALEGMAFFDWMAERILETLSTELEQHDRSDGPLPMSMAWSFPIEQTSLAGGNLQGMGKGFAACNDLLDQDLGEIVRTACLNRDHDVELRAIVNDSSACLLSESYNDNTTRFSLILGTGVNLAAYLPGLLEVVLASLQKPYSFSTKKLSIIERRSSALVSAGVHAFWNLRIDSQNTFVSTLSRGPSERDSAEADRDLAETTVAYNGGVIESYPGYLDSCQEYLNGLVATHKEKKSGNRTIKLVSAKESSLMGAAVALASLEEVVEGPLGVVG
ncbi:hexokinase [Fusarium mundagurra]|uniref:Phosphotransferase n=1 Tax=Fusarium mundagurra TaxID=1567541 RepID=A0A8H6D9S5_9HYPO|nr:hexokinase [Fusarium mundagurra]